MWIKKGILWFGLLCILASMVSNPPQEERIYNERLKRYLKSNFNISIDQTSKIVVLNSQGCFSCDKKALEYLESSKLCNSMHVIISNSFYNKISSSFPCIDKNILIDTFDVAEKINLPFYGTTLIKLDDGKISEVSQVTVKTIESNQLAFFFNH